jgi:transposase
LTFHLLGLRIPVFSAEMSNRAELSDEEWQAFYGLLLLNPRVYVGALETCRCFLNAVLWILRSGGQWRLLPASLGKWNSVFKRFSRWCKRGVWQSLHEGCRQHPDLQHVLIDSTIVRAHACAAGAAGSNAEAEALGRSKGGFTTKIHAITDALGNPLDFILTAGQSSDIGQAEALLQLTPSGAGALLGDKGYDSDAFVEAIQKQGMQAVIPPRSNRVAPRDCDWFVYKERHLIECFFGKIKHYRRVFSRFEKLARNYMGFIRFVSALIWLR